MNKLQTLLIPLLLIVRNAYALDQKIHLLCVNAKDYAGCVKSHQRPNGALAPAVKYDNYTLNSNFETFNEWEKKLLPALVSRNRCLNKYVCFVTEQNSRDQFEKIKPFRWIEYSTSDTTSYLYPFPESAMTITKPVAEITADRYLLFTVIDRYLTKPTMGTPAYTIGSTEIDNDCKASSSTTIRQRGIGSIDTNTYGEINLNTQGFLDNGIYRGYGSGSLNTRSKARVYGFDFDVNSNGQNRCKTTITSPTVVNATPGDPGGKYEQGYRKIVVNCLDYTSNSLALIAAGYKPKTFAKEEKNSERVTAYTAFGPWFYEMCQTHIKNPEIFPLGGIDPVTGKKFPKQLIEKIDRP